MLIHFHIVWNYVLCKLRPSTLSLFIVFFVCFCLGQFGKGYGNNMSNFLFLTCQNEKYSNITLSQHFIFPSWAWGKSKWPLCENSLYWFVISLCFAQKDCMYVINMSFYPPSLKKKRKKKSHSFGHWRAIPSFRVDSGFTGLWVLSLQAVPCTSETGLSRRKGQE